MKRKLLALFFCTGVAMCAAVAAGFGQHDQDAGDGPIEIPPGTVLRRLHYRPSSTPGTSPQGLATAGPISSVPTWTDTISSTADGSQPATTYTYTMVGTKPSPTAGQTVVPTVLIPVKLDFVYSRKATYVFDPTQTDSGCLAGSNTFTALSLTEQSPLFKNFNYTLGGMPVGDTQYVDAFQRANFWSEVSSNPNYHTLLGTLASPSVPGVTILPLQTVTVTSADRGNPNGAVYTASGQCGTNTGYINHQGYMGVMNINFWDPVAQSLLTKLGVKPTTFAIFLFYNAALSNGNPTNTNNCCILGYHNYFSSPAYTYAMAEFTEQNIFPSPNPDITALSHEVGEWMNDPFLTNTVPAWTVYLFGFFPIGCQNNLEVGDPLDGALFPAVTMPNGFTYNPQELAFFSWFFRENPSRGVNGWFSNNASFVTDAGPVCH